MKFKHVLEYNHWTSSSTNDDMVAHNKDTEGVDFDYVSKDKVLHGTRFVKVINPLNNKSLGVKAKFDTGAVSSSLDLKVAELLGIEEGIIEKCKEFRRIVVPRTMTLARQKALAEEKETELKREFPNITKVSIIRSSSSFSVRIFVKLIIEVEGRSLLTNINLKDRSGMSNDMLVGLNDLM